MLKQIEISTSQKVELVDITSLVEKAVRESKVKDGICIIFVPHTTGAITINENYDPSVVKDILKELNKIVPFEDNYFHSEGNSSAHIKSTIIGVSKTLIISDGKILLGTWQGIFFCEFDGPRRRKVILKILEG
jgi:secondary thiamine-phosphate synthase enzyme